MIVIKSSKFTLKLENIKNKGKILKRFKETEQIIYRIIVYFSIVTSVARRQTVSSKYVRRRSSHENFITSQTVIQIWDHDENVQQNEYKLHAFACEYVDWKELELYLKHIEKNYVKMIKCLRKIFCLWKEKIIAKITQRNKTANKI